MAKEKHVYLFGDKKAEGRANMKNLLGGKGANLAEMNLIGIPVPLVLPLPPRFQQHTMPRAKKKPLQ